MSSTLFLDNVSKTFHPGSGGEILALDEVSLTVEKGTLVVVIGTNGSGKSTLMNAIAGTVVPDSGRLSLDDEDITKWPVYKRARSISRVFQDPFTGTVASLTVAQNLAIASKRGARRGVGKALTPALRKRMFEELKMLGLGLEDRLDAPVGTLSGGQRQALTLIMATWKKPKLLLLDESTSALDPRSADLVLRLSQGIIDRHGLTAVLVTHSMQEAVTVGDRLLIMHAGKIKHDFEHAEKRRIKPEELYRRFEEIRQEEQLDETAAKLLKEMYV